jgi:hypothetical protein
MLVALLLGAGMLAAPTAQALVDNGTLSLGTQTTLTSTGWETYVYRATLPAGQRLGITSAASDTPTEGNLQVFDDATGTQVAVGSFGSRPGMAGQSIEVAPATTSRTLRIQFALQGAGVLPFTTATATDPPDRPIAWDTPATVTLDQPFQQALLTFTGVAGHRVGVTLAGATSPPTPPSGLTITIEGPHPYTGAWQPLYTVGQPGPALMMTAANYRLRIDGQGTATGTVTLTITDATDVTGTIALGQTVTADLATPWTVVRQTFAPMPGARLRFEVLSSTLRHADGTPGQATASHVVPGGYGTIRTNLAIISVTASSHVMPSPMGSVTPTLEIVPDGASTGSITYRLTGVPDNPPEPATLGQPIAVDLSQVYNTRRYTFDVPAGQRIAIDASDMALTSASTTPGLDLSLTDAGTGATRALPAPEPGQTSYSTILAASPAPTAWTLLLDPTADTVGSLTLTLRVLADVTVPLTTGATATGAIPTTGGDLFFTAPGTPGERPAITVEGNTLTDSSNAPATATMTFEQNGGPVPTTVTDAAGAIARHSFVLPYPVDPTQPWQVHVTTAPGVRGTLSLSLRPPTLTTATVTPGRTTRLRFNGISDSAELTVTPTIGKQIVVEVSNARTPVDLSLKASSGYQISGDATDYLELDAQQTTDPVVLTVRPARVSDHVGTVDVTIRMVSNPVVTADGPTTVRFGRGQNPQLTFPAEKGRRVSVAISSSSWQPGWRPVTATLLDPQGQPLAYAGSSTSGVTSFTDLEPTLLANGRYAIQFDPEWDAAGSLVATVRQITDLRRTARLGVPSDLTFAQPGQRAYLTVRVPEGRQIGWSMPRTALSGTISLLDPTGNQIGADNLGSSTLTGTFPTGPLAAGTYTVVVDPDATQTGRLRLTLTAS